MTPQPAKRVRFLRLAIAGYAAATLALSGGIPASASAQGPTKSLLRQLAAPASVHWRGAPLRQSLERLATETGTPLWIDRRVDPGRPLRLTSRGGSLASLLDAAADELDLGLAVLEGVVYLGPQTAAATLPRLVSERRRASAGMNRRREMAWPKLTTPRQLAEQIASEAGCQIENPESLPHDLWPAGSTPALKAGDRLTLLCLGFDLRWRVAGATKRRILIEPIPAEYYQGELKRLADLLPHEAPATGESRYTLRVAEQPLGAVLRQLAQQLGRRLRADFTPGQEEQRISFEVHGVNLEGLLGAVGDAAGVTVRATAHELIVGPGP